MRAAVNCFRGIGAKVSLGFKLAMAGAIACPAAALLLLRWDRPFAVWELLHPSLPNVGLPEVHIKTAEVEQELLNQMKRVRFVLLGGVPDCGKTSVVLRSARQRGAGVFYHRVSPCAPGLQGFRQHLESTYRAPLSPKPVGSAPLNLKLNQIAEDWRSWSSEPLVVIVDNVDSLSKAEAQELMGVGKVATEDNMFSLWLLSNKDEVLRTGCTEEYLKHIELPGSTTPQLVAMARGALGERCTPELANTLVYFSGRSLSTLLVLIEAVTRNEVIGQLRDLEPVTYNEIDKELWKLLLAAGDEGVKRNMRVDQLVDATANKDCFETTRSVVRPRSGACRDEYKKFLAMLEAVDAGVALEDARAAAASAPEVSRGPLEKLLARAEQEYETKRDAHATAIQEIIRKQTLLCKAVENYHRTS